MCKKQRLCFAFECGANQPWLLGTQHCTLNGGRLATSLVLQIQGFILRGAQKPRMRQ